MVSLLPRPSWSELQTPCTATATATSRSRAVRATLSRRMPNRPRATPISIVQRKPRWMATMTSVQ